MKKILSHAFVFALMLVVSLFNNVPVASAHNVGPTINFAGVFVPSNSVQLSWTSTSAPSASLTNHDVAIWNCAGVGCTPNISGTPIFEQINNFLPVYSGNFLHTGLASGTYSYTIREKHGGSASATLQETITIVIPPANPTLTLVKTVMNDNGGTATASSFQAKIDGNNVNWSTPVVVTAGAHTASEVTLAGYTASSWGGDCAADGTVTLAAGQNKTCTITNNDVAPKLTLNKILTQNNGGDLFHTVANWILSAVGPVNLSGTNGVMSGSNFKAGTYVLSESGPSGYSASDWDCEGGSLDDDEVTIGLGEDVNCTITNDDIAPTLTLVKNVVNLDGGTATQDDFQAKIDGDNVDWNEAVVLSAGDHTASETNLSGYSASAWGGDCDSDGSITLSPGQNATCTITNDDIEAGLTIKKLVTTNNGGDKTEDDFQGYINGDPVDWNDAQELDAGTYTLSEDGADGYSPSSWVCDGGSLNGNQVTIELGETVECTITNDDIAPTITLIKEVTNDNGGTADVNDFGLSIGGTSVDSGETLEVNANEEISINEIGLSGYSFVSITGDEGCPSELGGTVTLSEGQNITCTITNDDQPGTLIVKKVIEEGDAAFDDFSFSVNGGDAVDFDEDGQNEIVVNAGTYSVVEVSNPNYSVSYDNCSGVEIPNGGEATCTITNTFVPTPIPGCTDPEATNYNAQATVSDESCEYEEEESPRRRSSSGSRITPPIGQVLGEATEICNTVETYMRRGYKNNIPQVTILQNFLNGYMSSSLAVDGLFGPKTEGVVKAFQVARKENILAPWGLTKPTGIFYKTSLAEAKRLMCPETFGALPIPTDLIPWSAGTTQASLR